MAPTHSRFSILRTQWWIVLLCFMPFGYLLYRIATQQLNSADPAREVVLFLGLWSLRLLLVCLFIRPLRVLLNSPYLHPARRTIGLCALFYIFLHALAWVSFLMGWSIDAIIVEITDSLYILVGALALILLIPLGLTSTQRIKRFLGVYWQYIHRLIYVSAILACVHFLWLSKTWVEPMIYVTILSGLFLWRIIIMLQTTKRG